MTDYRKIQDILKESWTQGNEIDYYEGIKNQLQQGLYGNCVGDNIPNNEMVNDMIRDYGARMNEDTTS